LSSNQSETGPGTAPTVAGSDCAASEPRNPHGSVPAPHFAIERAAFAGPIAAEAPDSDPAATSPSQDSDSRSTAGHPPRVDTDRLPESHVDNATREHSLDLSAGIIASLPATPQSDQLAWYLSEQFLEIDRREQLLQLQLAQFDNERRQFRLLTGQREVELAERESAVERDRDELSRQLEQTAATESSQRELQLGLLRERRELQEQQEQFAADQAAIRQALADEVKSVHQQLDRERDDAARDIAALREELHREQQLVDSRRRFQEEHLQRTMREFEQNQLEFRVEQQQARTRLVETESQLLLHRKQLDKIRRFLTERERSINRDQQWLQTERRGLEIRLQQDRDKLRAEQNDWNATRTDQQAELHRQQEQVQLHAKALETRRQQLEVIGHRVEETHRENLELRLAVEEAYAQLTRTVGEEATRERVEQAQTLLAEHYRNSRDTLYIQRQELEQLQTRLATERSDLLFERQTLAQWVASEEQRLNEKDQNLERQRAALLEREQVWQQAADRWQQQKLEAEAIIRDLLRQLDEAARPASPPA